MYRARRKLQPKIPLGSNEFCEMISTASFGKFYQFSVTYDNETAAIFNSKAMSSLYAKLFTYSLMLPFIQCPCNLHSNGPFLLLSTDILCQPYMLNDS